MKVEKTALDSKGRIVLPGAFRKFLSLKEGDAVYIALDETARSITISNTLEERLLEITITMGDSPGTLARLAQVLSECKVDMVSTESHSITRSKEAVWRVIGKFEGNWEKLAQELKKQGASKVEKRNL